MNPKQLIRSLKASKKLRCYCPECDAKINMRTATLFTEDSPTKRALELKAEKQRDILELKKDLLDLKKMKLERVQRGTKSSNMGKLLERFVPILPGFKYRPDESVALLDPIDFISFNGLAKNKIDSIFFMDVKTGNGRLGNSQKSIKETIEAGRVSVELIEKGSA